MIFDSHAHYDDEQFDEDRENLLDSMEARGIGYIVNVGSSMETCRHTIEIVKRFTHVYGALGIHPGETEELNEEKFEWLKKSLSKPKIVAVGEIGLDYHWADPDRQVQKYWFERQLELAREKELPFIIHSRDAAADTLEIMKAHKAGEIGGVIHCFSYGKEIAKEYLDMGLYLGIGGVVTFANSRKLKEVVEYAPIEQLVLETDCPYLAPVPNRGKRNSSINLPYVANEIARIKNMAPQEVIDITCANAIKMYDIKIN